MSLLTWVLAGVLGFWLGAATLRARGLLPESVRVYGPLVTVHTRRGRELIDRVAAPRRFWRAWGNLGLGITLVVMVGTVLVLAVAAVALVQNPPTDAGPLSEPRNALVIPGVNPYLPLSVAPEILFGLAVGLVVHEGGHGILSRVADIEIESLGLVFLTIFPAGAFVQPGEESQRDADRGSRARMFAAGVTNNFAITVLAFLLLFGPVAGAMGVVSGAAVGSALPGSPAAGAGIDRGDVIVGIENRTVAENDDLDRVLDDVAAERVYVERDSGEPVWVNRSLLVTANVADGPLPFDANTTIATVNGTEVATSAALRAALADRPVATFTAANGETVTAPAGAYVSIAGDGPLATASDRNGSVVVTDVGGERTITLEDLRAALDDRAPGDRVPVTLYADGQREVHEVTLGEGDSASDAHLGVYLLNPGISGMEVSDFGVATYPAGRYLGLLGGSCPGCESFGGTSLGAQLYFIVALPFIGVAGVPALPFSFTGFVGPVASFFTVTGPLAGLGGGVFLLANLLFWTAWINLNLAFFNCIPTFFLDGGHILRTSAESVVSRLPVDEGRRLVVAVTGAVQLVMLASLLVMLFGGQL